MKNYSFKALLEFISSKNKMRMSHIYQPVMLMSLLRNNGTSTVEEIAKEILLHDQSQIEYYSKITKSMPAKVLGKNHGIVETIDDGYSLINFNSFTKEQVSELINACQVRLDNYFEQRGEAIFNHRKKLSGYISGTIRYEILKRAKFRCELCGISADKKALEVDHIIPRNNGGSDDESNLQALCYSCNAMKRDRDDTDFRGIVDSYTHREEGCLFCEMPEERVIAENELAYAIHDGYPVTDLHTLIIPKRHISSYFDLGRPEVNACNMLLDEVKLDIERTDETVTGFNIGINSGEDAGQTIFHCHIHLIPRRKNDVKEPRGGVRGVIPEKQVY